ncbi:MULTISPECIES: TetR family transcriptional regulator C-terminal domain-containing protein [unclassified Pseudomonas]|uniref:TetR family transcriptional regulator C-terminal domain-containing protein n=1 Tax=unclassified Pseudomonas TaxID=196821 RepID=UPI002AC8F646|nr:MULTISPECIES: TetR family transcriptional regulator C-terminal domain-containing protein [unclassified Pseudomonas]MEB0043324.1 TetR family transcriptional regulator C-terminal domain-containing protein [Pseudomonas sp. MH10]MEB0077499.1 TetR family transcriptional regulator C-terminal domain-containing protein [Pseudomonas sp. MH10out]MEB0090258.1 TetR family transcriptional regulator C-terminal domain-containing protein [Pseudomonas sp. CCI4.2]MEB0102594.1 TetR family transcriptional regul
MAKPSHRDKILTEGLKVVHERGFAGASVRDIVQAAGVPQGSFTNHFISKELFGLEILDLYAVNTNSVLDETLHNASLSPLARLRSYFDFHQQTLENGCLNIGCLYGNLAAEASEHSDIIRNRLVEIFSSLQDNIADCLKQAVAAGELHEGFECEKTALFIVSSLQGAVLLGKAQRSTDPLKNLIHILFDNLLR